MKKTAYRSMKTQYHFNRRKFLKMGSGLGSAGGFGLILASPPAWPGDTGHETLVGSPDPRPAELIIVACSTMFRKRFHQTDGLNLFLQSVQYLAFDKDVLTVTTELNNVAASKAGQQVE